MNRKAILIGINSYNYMSELSYAQQDAEGTAEALCRYCGFSESDIFFLHSKFGGECLALQDNIKEAIRHVCSEESIDLLVFGFWGHGCILEESGRYLCCIDTDASEIADTAISFDFVKSELTKAKTANTVMMLDCCQNVPSSRGIDNQRMTHKDEEDYYAMARDICAAQYVKHNNIATVAIMNSCSVGEKAYEWNRRKHGIFTAHLLDQIESGNTCVGQISSLIHDKVKKTTHGLYGEPQTPFIEIKGKGDVNLASGDTTGQPCRFGPDIQLDGSWWIILNDKEHGPCLEFTVFDLIRTGSIDGNTQVWRHPMKDWLCLSQIDIFNACIPHKPPKRKKKRHLDISLKIDIADWYYFLKVGRGTKRYIEKNYQQFGQIWKEASDERIPEGLTLYGCCFQLGLGTYKDLEQAVQLFQMAADQDFAAGQNCLGWCYLEGNGVAVDYSGAIKWFAKASAQGFVMAYCNLGLCYLHGLGVVQDKGQAVQLFRKAAQSGYASAQARLGDCYRYGDGVTVDYEQAIDWYRKAEDQGFASAQYSLGVCSANGFGMPKDQKKAVKWFRKAIEQGFPKAQCVLGTCYLEGRGLDKDIKQAVRWFRISAEQGVSNAQYHLANCLKEGLGITQDVAAAKKWYALAADQGHRKAKDECRKLA